MASLDHHPCTNGLANMDQQCAQFWYACLLCIKCNSYLGNMAIESVNKHQEFNCETPYKFIMKFIEYILRCCMREDCSPCLAKVVAFLIVLHSLSCHNTVDHVHIVFYPVFCSRQNNYLANHIYMHEVNNYLYLHRT